MEVVILGSSSAAPTLRRGLSSVAIVREGETILLDCGEGTQFQLMKAEIPRRKFFHIFITHLHGDHIFGLGGLISSLNLNQRDYPLVVHGPKGIERFIRFMVGFPRPTRLGFEVHVNELAPNFEGEVCRGSGYSVFARPLDHTIPALGYRIQEDDRPGRFDGTLADDLGVPFGPERSLLQRGQSITLADGRIVHPSELVGPARPGLSLAYCTDTAFHKNAKMLAAGADLLIHEATYGDEHADLAKDRKHSTIREAATIARDAGVRHFIATHFSTRYEGPSLRRLEAEGREVFPTLIMAEDLLRLTLEPPEASPASAAEH